MKGKLQLRKPENWQDFESLCKRLWGELWACPSTIKKHGRNGQDQHGVDIYAIPTGEKQYFGIQCKGKDDYSNSQLTVSEIDNEISKALTFTPTLKSFFFATTANKDAKIEAYVRQKNIESINNGGFSIDLFSWEDIVDLIESNKDTYNWYLHDLPFSDSYKVSIGITSTNTEHPYTLFPQFIKKITKHQVKPLENPNAKKNPFDFLIDIKPIDLGFFPHHFTTNYQWCRISLGIINEGNLPLEQYKIEVSFESDAISEIDNLSGYSTNPMLSDIARAEINRNARERQEVFLYSDDDYSLCIEAKKDLVQKDSAVFHFRVKPNFDVKQLNIHWELKAKNFNTEGENVLFVEPIIEESISTILVDNENELKPDEIVIEPKKITK